MTARFRWICGLILTCWIGANCVVLIWNDVFTTANSDVEFCVPNNVIRCYDGQIAETLSGHSRALATLSYRYRPPPASAGKHAVPLVVFLHGAGELGSDNVRQLRYLPSVLCAGVTSNAYPCAVLAPQCPEPGPWTRRIDANSDPLDVVLRMIDGVLADPRIDPRLVFLVGLSMEGNGTWELAIRAPERFAAVVSICGWGDESRVESLRDTPLWAVHGADDPVVSVSKIRSMIAALENVGGHPRFLEMSGVGHNCWDAVFRKDSEVLAWMFAQSRKSTSGEMTDQ